MNLFLVRKRIGQGALLLVGATVLAGVYDHYIASSPPIPPPLPRASPNGYDFYIAAARALVPAHPPVDAINDSRRLSPAEAAIDYSPARRAHWIASNARIWNLVARALATPASNPHARDATLSMSPDYKPLRELARGQSIRISDFKAQNNWNAALSTGLDTLQMGRDVERGGNLIASLVGIAIEAIGQRALDDVPSHLNAGEARAGATRLSQIIAAGTPFSAVLGEEKAGYDTYIEKNWDKAGNPGAELQGQIILPKARMRRSFDGLLDGFIAQADKPAQRQTQIKAPPFWNFPATTFYPVFARCFFNDQRRKTIESMLLLRLALRAYGAENGAFPARIEALRPKYLAKIPVDAFGRGETMRYQSSGNSYRLWSIGPDGIDNSGAPILNKLGHKPRYYVSTSRGDVVVGP